MRITDLLDKRSISLDAVCASKSISTEEVPSCKIPAASISKK